MNTKYLEIIKSPVVTEKAAVLQEGGGAATEIRGGTAN